MILVTVGTNEAPFDRLLEAVGRLRPSEELLVQRGSSQIAPCGAHVVEFLPFDELVQQVQRARIVVSHAGVGSIIVALANGRRPVVMPRRRRHREAVDDHQVAFARRFEASGLVTVVETDAELEAAVAASSSMRVDVAVSSELALDIRRYVESCVTRFRPTAPRLRLMVRRRRSALQR